MSNSPEEDLDNSKTTVNNSNISAAETNDLIHMLETTDLSDDDVEDLLKDAYALNKLLKQELASREKKAATANREVRNPEHRHSNKLPSLSHNSTSGTRKLQRPTTNEAKLAEIRSAYSSTPSKWNNRSKTSIASFNRSIKPRFSAMSSKSNHE